MDTQVDTLTISLTDYINKTTRQNKITGVSGLFVILCCFFPFIVYALKIGMFDPQARWTIQFFFGCFLFCVTALIVIIPLIKERKVTQLVDDGAPKAIILNSAGIEFPAFLLISSGRTDVPEAGKLTVKILWNGIFSWHVINGTNGRVRIPASYMIQDSKEPYATYLDILRVLPKEDENILLDFAQQYLTSPIKVQKLFGYKNRKLVGNLGSSAYSKKMDDK